MSTTALFVILTIKQTNVNELLFFKEIQEIPGVTYVEVKEEAAKRLAPGVYIGGAMTQVHFMGVGQYGEEISVCIKHPARLFAMEAAINLANQFCTQPVL